MHRFIVLSLLAIGMQILPQVHAWPESRPLVSTGVHAEVGNGPYFYLATADASADVRRVLKQARRSNKPVLVFFGANWCEDCRSLAKSLDLPRNASLMARDFNVVKVDAGNFDRNLDVVDRFGGPIAKGIPTAVLLSPDGTVRYSTKAGELSSARRMSAEIVHDFFVTLRVKVGG